MNIYIYLQEVIDIFHLFTVKNILNLFEQFTIFSDNEASVSLGSNFLSYYLS